MNDKIELQEKDLILDKDQDQGIIVIEEVGQNIKQKKYK